MAGSWWQIYSRKRRGRRWLKYQDPYSSLAEAKVDLDLFRRMGGDESEGYQYVVREMKRNPRRLPRRSVKG